MLLHEHMLTISQPCVETALCLSGQTGEGDKNGLIPNTFHGWDDECWDRPEGVHAVSFSVDNGHGFTAVDKTCDELKADYEAGTFSATTYFKGGSDDNDEPTCLLLPHDHVKAVYYNW